MVDSMENILAREEAARSEEDNFDDGFNNNIERAGVATAVGSFGVYMLTTDQTIAEHGLVTPIVAGIVTGLAIYTIGALKEYFSQQNQTNYFP